MPKKDANRISNNRDRNDTWQTPQYIFDDLNELFELEIDLAASAENTKCKFFLTEQDNALQTDWLLYARLLGVEPRGWCNPPYKHLFPWLELALYQMRAGFDTFMLLPPSIDNRWFSEIAHPYALNYFYVGGMTETKNTARIEFVDPISNRSNATKGNLLSIFTEYDEELITQMLPDYWRKL